MKLKSLVLTLICFSGLINASFACTKFTNQFQNGNVYTARTFDLCVDIPYNVIVYPRGYHGDGGVLTGKNLTWINKYGVVAIRQVNGKVTADVDGLNEKGLGINLLYLDKTKYPKRDLNKPGIDMFKWVSYALGSYASVKEVLDNLNDYQIITYPTRIADVDVLFPIHISIEDASGDNAVIEFIHGKIKIYHDSKYNIMTNEPVYEKQLQNLAKIKKTKNYSEEFLPGGANAANRFVRASFYSQTMPERGDNEQAIADMLNAVKGVSVPYFKDYTKHCGFVTYNPGADAWPTQWTTIFDHKNKVLYLYDSKTQKHVKVDLTKFDLNDGQPLKVLDVATVNLDQKDVTGLFKSKN